MERVDIPGSDRPDRCEEQYNFHAHLSHHGLRLRPTEIKTLQVNITKLCNQACRHCHVDASPVRTEVMSKQILDECLSVLVRHQDIRTLDITGGAPELHPHFDYFVREAKKIGKHVIVRHNLTVTFDGNPRTGESKEYLPKFFAELGVEIISSLPYYEEYFTDKQRGKGVFTKSMASLRLLNDEGYGMDGSGKILNLVYNPAGAFLPASQSSLELQFRRSLAKTHALSFNNLFVLTNMPIHRFKDDLKRHGNYEEYMDKLSSAFNPLAAQGVMCRSLISVGYDGRLYDCDFNQMLDLSIRNGRALTITDFNHEKMQERDIIFQSHCLGCTAGSGSSCGGVTTA